jgi:hypothetical protein
MPCAVEDYISPIDVLATTASFFGGSIELDPASSENANTYVGAQKYFSPRENGLKQSWKSKNVYLYPPKSVLYSIEQPPEYRLYVKRRRFVKSAQRIWMEEMLRRYRKAEFDEGILFLTSSEVALITTQRIGLDLPICIMKEHPKILTDTEDFRKVNTNKCFGFIFYFPSLLKTENRVLEFSEAYSPLGRVYY